ncbi:hypothetical protein GFH48_16775 [Streptomyces fagopyri]|uniref:DUF4367 domain-containing protein n=1 Tax=Streptomyces fagopyri TaxID=2662397 RepID=A0A5Q0LCN8_9ACTN|nr:hypothetical protein [Streptomyces fagopyri]QFZ74698.1 hypothetical protein GFH48_16775 [Streptomyces fagopyri]
MSEPHRGQGPGASGDRETREGAPGLAEELRALGRSLTGPGGSRGESMAERVLERILAERIPVPVAVRPGPGERLRAVRRWVRLRGRVLTAGLCGLLTVLVLTPPVRAAVVDWFGFGGVEVRYDPSAVPSPGAEVPGCGPSLTLAEAGRRAGFAPLVPDVLGVPDAVTVTRDPKVRFLMTLCWREHGRTVRLDEYPAGLDIGFTKTVREPPEWVPLGVDGSGSGGADADFGDPALWFPRPHLLSFWLVDASGGRVTRSERTAGPTLLWTRGGEVTLRLEGVASKARAVEIARSLDPRK